MRKLYVIIWLSLISSAIISMFWYNEWVYKLPTPVPANYSPVAYGEFIGLPSSLRDSSKPVFLHFFNPDCPCSRFNMQYFKKLVKAYGNDICFKIVVVSNDRYNEIQVQQKFGLALPVLFDTSLARICGVYSTPQAVLITSQSRLYFRGNYNRNRYCTDEKTKYAEIALNALIHHMPRTAVNRLALSAYGCELPHHNIKNYD